MEILDVDKSSDGKQESVNKDSQLGSVDKGSAKDQQEETQIKLQKVEEFVPPY